MKVKTRFTYRGPVGLYVSYYVLFTLSILLITLSFRVEQGSTLFLQLLITGIGAALVSVTLILYYTQLDRKIVTNKWKRQAESYYNDEGIFEYSPVGFTVITQDGKSLSLKWEEILRAESGESKINSHVKRFHIDLFLSERELLTVDSTMPGFSLFEKRLKENLRDLLKREVVQLSEEPDSSEATAKIS